MTAAPAKKSDLGVRAASAVVMAAIAGTALWLGGWVWTVFVAAVALGVLWEWSRLVTAFQPSAVRRFAWMIGGLLYIGLAASLLAVIGNGDAMGGSQGQVAVGLLAPLILVVIATDVGAYFTGRLIGGPKIAPKISPSKTWSGLLGGMIFAGGILAIFAGIGAIHLSVSVAAGVGALLAVVAQTGDFFESWMKRRAGVKDSGKVIPGHGGLFDRVDGLLAVANAVAIALIVSLASSTDL